MAAISASKHSFGNTYNITNGEPMPVGQFARMLFETLGMNVRYRKIPYSLAITAASCLEVFYKAFKPGVEPPISRYSVGLSSFSQTLDISAARRDLGYAPKIPLIAGIRAFSASKTI